MKPFACAATLRRLDAFHDQELPVDEQIAVSAHLDWCDACAAASADLRMIGAMLRSAAPGRAMLAANETDGVNTAGVVNRLKAERALRWLPWVQFMCEDLHLVCAGGGAAVAALVCMISLSGMMRLSAAERPDSLAGIVNVLAIRLECEPATVPGEFVDISGCRARFSERFQRSTDSAEEDAVFALDAAVINQGHLESLETLKASRHEEASGQVKLIEDLIDTVSRARLENLQSTRGVLWLVTDTTVRATKPPAVDLQPPAEKKRALAVPSQSPIRNS
jgi:anti-sigma factor RsiW